MANVTISGIPTSATTSDGTELLEIEQAGTSKQIDLDTLMSNPTFSSLKSADFVNDTLRKILAGTFGDTDVISKDGIISGLFTNEVLDPEDLTTANWVNTTTNEAETSEKINGVSFWKLTNTAAATSFITQSFAASKFTNSQVVVHGILRKGSAANSEIRFSEGGTIKLRFNVTFSTQTISELDGTLLKAVWIDATTVEVWGLTEVFTVGNTTDLKLLTTTAINGATSFFAQPMIVDSADSTLYPYVSGTHAADDIQKTQTMQDKFSWVLDLECFFDYTTTGNKVFFDFVVTGSETTKEYRLNYVQVSDTINLVWEDGGSERSMSLGPFDDGTSLLDINEDYLIVGTSNLTTGDTTGSGIWLVKKSILEIVASDITWSGASDVKTSDFTDLYIGQFYNNTLLANSKINGFTLFNGSFDETTISSYTDISRAIADLGSPYQVYGIKNLIQPNAGIKQWDVALRYIAELFFSGNGMRDGAINGRHPLYNLDESNTDESWLFNKLDSWISTAGDFMGTQGHIKEGATEQSVVSIKRVNATDILLVGQDVSTGAVSTITVTDTTTTIEEVGITALFDAIT